jgi:hypothetical protein
MVNECDRVNVSEQVYAHFHGESFVKVDEARALLQECEQVMVAEGTDTPTSCTRQARLSDDVAKQTRR